MDKPKGEHNFTPFYYRSIRPHLPDMAAGVRMLLLGVVGIASAAAVPVNPFGASSERKEVTVLCSHCSCRASRDSEHNLITFCRHCLIMRAAPPTR